MKIGHRGAVWLGIGAILACSSCSTPSSSSSAPAPDSLIYDPAVVRGRLTNGISYVIRQNTKPKDRVELRLVVNAGSLLEDDAQQGLAHFVEHMAFNGTKHFAKNELVDYLESIGMTFGPDLNAYTSFDETVYMLQAPTGDAEILDTAFQILADWAGGVTMTAEEIDKERGVVIEEWRGRRGADQRIRDKQLPVLLKDSRYAERLPIGKKEILDSFQHELLRRYYRDWYRPEQMTVIAVGDVEPGVLEARVKKYFGSIPVSPDTLSRQRFEVPDQPDLRVSVVADPEATRSRVSVTYLRPVDSLRTRSDYRRFLADSLFTTMLNMRFEEILKKPNPPFLNAHAHKGRLVRSKGMFMLGATVEDGGLRRGLNAVLAEGERLRRFGFTEGELARARKMRLRMAQVAFNERNTTESSSFASEYVSDVVHETISPGIEVELGLHHDLLGGISLAELNRFAEEWITETNCVVLASAPEKVEVELPSEDDLAEVFGVVAGLELEPYFDDMAIGPLLGSMPPPGEVTKKTVIEDLGIHRWTLSNGVEMLLKPTDFKTDEVFLSVFSPGGHSMVGLDEFISGSSAASVAHEGGMGSFSRVQLNKMLAGKVVELQPYISELKEGFEGGCSPEDIEILFQLLHLGFVAPREDQDAFASYQERTRSSLENRRANPRAIFSDTIIEVMSQGHFRRKPWTPDTVDHMDLGESISIYRDRFSDADDFVFILVGNLDLNKVEELARRYLATLPVKAGDELWIDHQIVRPVGEVSRTIRKGIDQKAQVLLMYWDSMEWKFEERFRIQSMLAALRIRLREALREDLGGTYGVSAYPSLTHYPDPRYLIHIAFGCSPGRVDQLVAVVEEELTKLKSEPLPESYLTKVKEGQLMKRETDLKTNGFWKYILQFYEWHHEDPRIILEFDEIVNALTAEDIRATAEQYFGTSNQALFTLLPELQPTPSNDM